MVQGKRLEGNVIAIDTETVYRLWAISLKETKKVSTKKEQAVGIACSFLQQEEKQTMKLLITHKKSKVNKKMLLFYNFVKKMSICLT